MSSGNRALWRWQNFIYYKEVTGFRSEILPEKPLKNKKGRLVIVQCKQLTNKTVYQIFSN